MDEFINSVTGKLGIDSSTAKSATSSLLGLIKKEGDSSAVGELFAKLPGASAMADAGGSAGGLLGKVSGMLGGTLGSGGAALGGLAKSGLSADKIPDFVQTFIDWAKEKAGPDIVNKVVAAVPALKSIVG